jgi:hypothetical protein
VGINPPGFGWWRAKGASSYRLIVRDPANYEAAGLTEPVHLPNRTGTQRLDATKKLPISGFIPANVRVLWHRSPEAVSLLSFRSKEVLLDGPTAYLTNSCGHLGSALHSDFRSATKE